MVLPVDVSASVKLIQDLATVCECIPAAEEWRSAKDEQDCHAIFALHVAKVAATEGIRSEDTRTWQFGKQFIASVEACALGNTEAGCRKLLKSCAEAILKLNLGAVHPLRVGPGPNDEQIRRGRLKAWRRDIDYEFHLHYWDDGSNVILSTVGVHGNFDIF